MKFERLIRNIVKNDSTNIKLLDVSGRMIAKGNWFNDNILKYIDVNVLDYITDDNKLIARLSVMPIRQYVCSASLNEMVVKYFTYKGHVWEWNDLDCVWYRDDTDEEYYMVIPKNAVY